MNPEKDADDRERGLSGSLWPVDSADVQLERVLDLALRVLNARMAVLSVGSAEEIQRTLSRGGTMAANGEYCAVHEAVMRKRNPVVVDATSTNQSERALIAASRFSEAESLVAVPLLIRKRVPVGSLVVTTERRTFSDNEVRVLDEMASLITSCYGVVRAGRRSDPDDGVLRDERMLCLVENAIEAFVILDEACRMKYVSGRPLPFDADGKCSITECRFLDFVHEDDREAFQSAFNKALRSPGEPISAIEFRMWRTNGAAATYNGIMTNLLANEAVAGVVLNCYDVTERKEYEARLEVAKEQAEEMSRLKTGFLTNLSHEIRTPLSGILGFAGILAGELRGDQKEFAQMIERSGRRLMATLNAVLDLARLEADRVEMRSETLDVVKEVGDLIKLSRASAQEKGLFLKYAPAEKSVMARVDRSYLGRIVDNLISNAIRFTDLGGVNVEVTVLDRLFRIDVADTGVGISRSMLPDVFEEFRRDVSAREDADEGPGGVGLAITHRLVKLMGGQITVESEKGKGSKFSVTLPRFFAPDAETDAASRRPILTSVAKDGRRVLVLDDSHLSRVLVERILERRYRVDSASTAEEAMKLLVAQVYDLVLLDINLGTEKSGVDVLDELRTIPGYQDVPVVALTAYALPGDRERFVASGFDYHLGKPYTKQELLKLVDQIFAV